MRDLGAVWLDDRRCRFRVWAPSAERVELHTLSPSDRNIPMEPRDSGYHQVTIEDIQPGVRYRYRLAEGREFADPASCFQPEGVHGPSEVIASHFPWTDENWRGIPLENYIIYELHTGAFTPKGTFDAIIPRLDDLVHLGITAIELMPVAQFPGERNWGYDGVFPYAAQSSYGGPVGLKQLVDACHRKGLAVILDVVYNHIGPEGNYLAEFGPYFTDHYKTPWGPALNYDDARSDEVRHYFLQNALYWITEFHIDALRLDAVHAILDLSAQNILEELADRVHERGTELNRRIYAIAESALNDTRLIRSQELGGYGLDAQWNDDFHHSLHTLLTREKQGYYGDFGDFQHMAQAFSEGFVYAGKYSTTRQRRHGNSSREIPPSKFVVYAQNHDQIGNRVLGERLRRLVTFEECKLAAAMVLLSPFIPLLFMGDEYGETAPFQYFVSHSDPGLIDAVRRGRKAEFADFNWRTDPQDEQTFHRSRLNYDLRRKDEHRALLEFHRELIRLRRSRPAFRSLSKNKMDVFSLEDDRVLIVRRWESSDEVVIIFNFNDKPVRPGARLPHGSWNAVLNSSEQRWMGQGKTLPNEIAAASVAVWERKSED
jgi:maltooligosyltrehalose trehalohydrolase